MDLNKRNIILIGVFALVGAFVGVLADLFSAWSNTPNTMKTALSIDIESIKGIFSGKPRWTFVLGNYLGVFFIPFHMFGFFLVYRALKPAGNLKAIIFLIVSFYLVALGAGFHGTLAFIGDIIQSGNNELLMNIAPYWQNWGIVVIVGYLIISFFLFALIVSGKTMYTRKTALLSPISLLLASTVFISLLPEEFYGAKKFFAVTGLNLPLLIFYIATMKTLLDESNITNLNNKAE